MAANLPPDLFLARVEIAPTVRARLNGTPTKDFEEWLMGEELMRLAAVDEQYPALSDLPPE